MGFLMTIRLQLVKGGQAPFLSDLRYLPDQYALMYEAISFPAGCNLFAGPTNSGKSTTMAALLEERQELTNHEEDLITVEDPVEYLFRSPAAYQLPLLGTWSDELKSVVRQAPRSLMLGEVRDEATARAIFNFVLAGHPVTCSLHTDSIFNVPERLMGMGAERRLVFNPDLLKLLVCQTLLPKLCMQCRVPVVKGGLDRAQLERIAGVADLDKVYAASGQSCGHIDCDHGHAGRTPAAEVCLSTPEMFDIFDREGPRSAKQYWVNQEKGITKAAHALLLMQQGLVDPRPVERITGYFKQMRRAA
jgi:type II secretory ATPase GspE/PulE/Tfp pilus assembly ATPase PilB-like protein